MFFKICFLAVVASLVSALTLEVPENPTSGGTINIKWISAAGDPPTWSFELTNTAFNDAFAIANNVNPTAENLTLTLPIVPVGDGYTLQAVNIGNITDVFASTPDFAIGPTVSTSASSTSSRTSSSTGSATTSAVVTTSSSATSVVSSNIVTSSQTTPATSSTGNSTVSSTPFAGALSSRLDLGSLVGGITAVILSAAAGAAMIAF